MKCPFKNCGFKEDIKEFDEPIEHLVLTLSSQGHIHAHGPFADAHMMQQFVRTLISEMNTRGIKFVPEELEPIIPLPQKKGIVSEKDTKDSEPKES